MDPQSSSTSTQLLRRVRATDAEAWRRLVDCYGPLVWHWCRRAGLQDHDGADVFQQVFQAVYRGIANFARGSAPLTAGGPKQGTFRGWLLVVTQNQIRDHFRRNRGRAVPVGGTEAYRQLMSLSDPDADESRTSSGGHPVSQLVHTTLEKIRPDFEPNTWQAFWRSTVDGLPSSEVAAELGMTAGAVRKAKARVLGRLRLELGDL